MLSPKQAWQLLLAAGKDWSEDNVPRLAAALAYYTAISLAPLLVLSVIMLEKVAQDAPTKVENQMEMLMGPAGKAMAHEMILNAKETSSVMATIVSFIVLLFGASGVFAELQDAMNTIWEVKPKPDAGWGQYLRKRFLSLAMVFGVGFLLLVSLIASTVLASLVHRIAGEGKVAGFLLDVTLTILVATLMFAAIFRLLPDVRIAWRQVWFGALLTAALFTIGKYALTFYLTRFAATSAYGTAGSLAAVLIWVYYSGYILFFGAEVTQVYANQFSAQPTLPEPGAEPVTAEKRRQQGLEPKATTAEARGEFQTGGSRTPQPAIAPRTVVTIEQPSQMNRKGYLLAAGGLAAGAILGAAGVFTGRKWGEPRLTALQINQRLDQLEGRLGRDRSMKRYGRELALAERVAQIEQRVTQAATSLRQTFDPPWYTRLRRTARKPAPWYERFKRNVT